MRRAESRAIFWATVLSSMGLDGVFELGFEVADEVGEFLF